LETSRCDCFS